MTKAKLKSSKIGKLEYDLNDPSAQSDMRLALNASSMGCILNELDDKLRHIVKYENRASIKIDKVRSMLSELIQEYYPGFYEDFR